MVKAKKSPRTTASAPAQNPPVAETETATTASASTEAPDSFEAVCQTIRTHLTTAERSFREVRSLLKRAEQFHRREQRIAQQQLRSSGRKRRRERDPNAPKRAPSGIAKPTIISSELANFLNVTPTTKMARTDVIKKIASYIKTNNLENPKNRRHILPDKALGKLLAVKKNDQVTYFNLQRFMSPHFPKAEVVASK